jgi:hypothetical protein
MPISLFSFYWNGDVIMNVKMMNQASRYISVRISTTIRNMSLIIILGISTLCGW